MKTEDIEKALKGGRYIHLKDDVLVSFRDQQLDAISRTQAEVHLNLCQRCTRRLLLLRGELAATDSYEPDAEDRARAKLVVRGMEAAPEIERSSVSKAAWKRFTEYVLHAAASWQAFVMQLERVRGATHGGTEMWRWQSDDGRFTAYAVLEPNADLTLHFSTSDRQLKGARLKVKVGPLNLEAMLQRISESESHAEITIKRRQRPKHLNDIFIEIA